jgi:hypothetical protein
VTLDEDRVRLVGGLKLLGLSDRKIAAVAQCARESIPQMVAEAERRGWLRPIKERLTASLGALAEDAVSASREIVEDIRDGKASEGAVLALRALGPMVTSRVGRQFQDADWVREHGADYVAEIVGRRGLPSDAAYHLGRVLCRIPVSDGPDKSKGKPSFFVFCVSVQEYLPTAIGTRPIAVLLYKPPLFEGAPGHWYAATWDNPSQSWYTHDNGHKTRIGPTTPTSLAAAYIWLLPRDGGATKRCSDTGTRARCNKGKAEHAHRGAFTLVCCRCKRGFIDDCTDLRDVTQRSAVILRAAKRDYSR